MNTKLVPETVHYIKFRIRNYLHNLCLFIYLESSTKVYFTIQTPH